jgi:hypothetical protein
MSNHTYRRNCTTSGPSRPNQATGLIRGQVSIHRHCVGDPFRCMNRLNPLSIHSLTTSTPNPSVLGHMRNDDPSRIVLW